MRLVTTALLRRSTAPPAGSLLRHGAVHAQTDGGINAEASGLSVRACMFVHARTHAICAACGYMRSVWVCEGTTMYVCMRVCMHVCMRVCMCVCMRVCMCACARARMHTHTCTHTHTMHIPYTHLHTAAVVREVRALAADGLLSSGIQVAARVRGRPLVSVWGGCCARTARPVAETSLFHPWSVAKGVASTALCIVAAREGVSFDDRVTRVWPGFARGGGRRGKGDTTIAAAAGYRGGMPEHPPLASQALDAVRGGWRRHWEAGIRWVEEYEPEWEPGARASYHPMSYSWIVGGIVERADGQRRHIRQVVSEGVPHDRSCLSSSTRLRHLLARFRALSQICSLSVSPARSSPPRAPHPPLSLCIALTCLCRSRRHCQAPWL